ncbi:hypothetical protein [Terriglobus albidus]|uniref:hypothetical protein n=1 Tax=Terriglobus albidus TaxID=1592106 RepID=UPI0021E0AC8D|nr:hypothetical protein [Terriglobus albidus]
MRAGERIKALPETSDDRWKLVEEILQSPGFSKASRLSSFFSYICLHTLRGNSVKLNERQIGIEVFNRAETYNPAEDSIVRASARILRSRLEHYFSSVDPRSKWIISIPKGGYVPTFELRPALDVPGESPAVTPKSQPVIPPTQGWRRALIATGISVVALLIVCSCWLLFRSHSAPLAGDRMWSELLTPNRRTFFVPADSALSLLQTSQEHALPLTSYMNHDYRALLGQPGSEPSAETLRRFRDHPDTSIADLNMAFRVGRLPQAKNAQLEVRYTRYLTFGDVKSSNLILLGGVRANPWGQLFADKIDYSVGNDPAKGVDFVAVRSPRDGEQARYSVDPVAADTYGFGIVAFTSGIDGVGHALLLEGTSMAGTEAVCDFVLDQNALSSFEKKVTRPDGRLGHFELLIKARVVQGNSSAPEIVAYRLLP